MKIVGVSNFGKDSIADVLIAENVHKNYINDIVDYLNKKHSDINSTYYMLKKENDYKLWQGLQELV